MENKKSGTLTGDQPTKKGSISNQDDINNSSSSRDHTKAYSSNISSNLIEPQFSSKSKQAAPPVEEQPNVYTNPKEIERQWNELHEEYMRENEKEVPAHSSKILYQCLHPLQDSVQDAFSHLVHERRDKTTQMSIGLTQVNQEQHQQASYAYEYLLILEQLTQAAINQSQTKEAISNIGEQVSNPQRYNLVADKNLLQKSATLQNSTINIIDKTKQKKDMMTTLIEEEKEEWVPQKKKNGGEHNVDRLESTSFQMEMLDTDPDGGIKFKNKIEGYSTELFLGKTISTKLYDRDKDIDFNYREWILSQEECQDTDIERKTALPTNIGLINNEDEEEDLKDDDLQSVEGHANNLEAKQTKLRGDLDETTTQPCKQYRLSMWRLDKEQLTKLIIAEQTFTVWNPNLDILKNKFCFSIDKNLIHITLKDAYSDNIRKTISFKSLDLSYAQRYDFVYTSGNIKGENLVCDPVMYMDTDGQVIENEYDHDDFRDTQTLSKSYFMYFQDQNRGYFCYKNPQRNADFNLVSIKTNQDTELQQKETIKHVFFGLSEEKDHLIVVSQIEKIAKLGTQSQQKYEDNSQVIFFKVETINMYSFILSSNKQVKEFLGKSHQNQGNSRSTYITMDPSIYQGLSINRAFFHRRHGIIMEISLPEAPLNSQIMLPPLDADAANEKTLILISSSVISKNQKTVEPKIFKIRNLKIPLNPQYQSKLCMKGSYKNDDFLFFFEDLVGSKGSMQTLYENSQLIKVAPSKQQVEAQSTLVNIPQQFCDFIVSTEKKTNVNELTITDVDINTTDEYLSRPLITFITHNYLAVQEKQWKQTNYMKKNSQAIQQQYSQATDSQTLLLDSQHLYYNEPYILSVENQITLNIYNIITPSKNYRYQLTNHFECFLDLQELQFILPQDENNISRNRFYRHQICMMLTYDLIERCHRVEIMVMPTYSEMNQENFQMITLPYKLDLNLSPGSIQNVMIQGHFHQLVEFTNHKHNGKTITKEKLIDSLILQFFDSVIQVDLGKHGSPQKLLLEMDPVPLMENRASNLRMVRIDTNGKLLKELMIKTQALQKKDSILPQKELRKKFGDRRYYLILQPGFNYGGNQSSTHIWLIEISCSEFELEKQVVYEFTTSLGEQPSEILQMSLSTNDSDGLTLLILDRQFVVKKFKIKVKTKQVQLKLIEETIPNDEAEKVWTDLLLHDQKLQMPELSFNFKNLNPREIVLTDRGVYLESMFFSIIFKSDDKQESLLEFEAKRDKDVSSKLHNKPLSEYQVSLNFSGALKSPDSTSLLLFYRKQKVNYQQNNQILKPASKRVLSKNPRISQRLQFKNQENHLSVSNSQVKLDVKTSFFFLSIPTLSSKLQQLIPLDTLSSQQVEYTTFIGTENDDILVKLKSSENSHGFLIFSANGALREIKVTESEEFYPILNQFQVLQFLSCSTKINNTEAQSSLSSNSKQKVNQNLIKLQKDDQQQTFGNMLESETSELIQKVLLVNQKLQQYIIMNIHRFQDVYTISLQTEKPLYISPLHNIRRESQRPIEQDSLVSYLKLQLNPFDGKTNLVRFLFDNKYKTHNQDGSVLGRTNSQGTASFIRMKNLQQNSQIFSTLYFDINDGRQKTLEEQFIQQIIQKDVQKNPQMIKDKSQQSLIHGQYNRLTKKNTKDMSEIDQESLIPQQQIELTYTIDDFDLFLIPVLMKGETLEKEYFVFRCRNQIHYAEVAKKDDSQGGNELSIHDSIKKINVEFREPGFITQVLQVQRQDQLQIMYNERFTGNFYLILWDLTNNQEVSMQTFKTTLFNPFFQIYKGAITRENYLIHIGSEYIQDLRLEIPQNYLSGKKAWRGFDLSLFSPTLAKTEQEAYNKNLLSHFREYRDEFKISYSCTKALGLNGYGKTQVQRSYSYLDLQYVQYLLQRFLSQKAIKEDTRKPLIFEYLSVQMPYEINIMHYFATNKLFLELYLQEITSQRDKTEESVLSDKQISFIYYSLLPNSFPMALTRGKGRRPFSIALKSNQGACFELIIKMLMSDSKKCYIKDIKQYLQALLVQRSDTVRDFLSHHTTRYLFNQKVSSHLVDSYMSTSWGKVFKATLLCREANFKQFTPQVTQYLNDDEHFLMLSNQKKKDFFSRKSTLLQALKRESSSTKNVNDKFDELSKQRVNTTYSDDENDNKILSLASGGKNQALNIKQLEDKKTIQFNSYDFEGYMYGHNAEEFLKFITNQTNNLGIFELKYIQRLIDYQWQCVSRQYNIVIFFYTIKIMLMIIYIISLQGLINCKTEGTGDSSFKCSQTIFMKLLTSQWDYVNDYFVAVLVPLQLFITIYEVLRYERMSGLQGIFVILFNLLHLMKLVTDTLLLCLFRIWYVRYNLQTDELKDDYWHQTDPANAISLDREYLVRAANSWIFIIKGGNAFLMISLPLILLYKWRFHPFISVYIPRFFLVLSSLVQLLIFFILLSMMLQYSYKILAILTFDLPSKDKEEIGIDQSIETYVIWMAFVNTLYRESMSIGIIAVIVLIILYSSAAIIKADALASKNFQAQKYINLAKLIYEGKLLSNRAKKFAGARYIIESVVEKSNNTFMADALTQDEELHNEQLNANGGGLGGTSAQQNDQKNSGDALNIAQIRELLAKERQHNDQQISGIKNALANLEKHLAPQEADAFESKM